VQQLLLLPEEVTCNYTCGYVACLFIAPDAEVTITEKTVSVKKEKVTMVGDMETRIVESSPTFSETLMPITEVTEGETVRYASHTVFPVGSWIEGKREKRKRKKGTRKKGKRKKGKHIFSRKEGKRKSGKLFFCIMLNVPEASSI